MYCTFCGAFINEDKGPAKFCEKCGTSLQGHAQATEQVQAAPDAQSYGKSQASPQSKNTYGSYLASQQQSAQPYASPLSKSAEKLATASFVLGLLSLFFCCCGGSSLPCGLLAIILGSLSKPKSSKAVWGIITGAIGALMGALLIGFTIINEVSDLDYLQDVIDYYMEIKTEDLEDDELLLGTYSSTDEDTDADTADTDDAADDDTATADNSTDSTDIDEALIATVLDNLSAWNMYADVRASGLDFDQSLQGSWRLLDGSEELWVFTEDNFYWYRSAYDFDDNYWYGYLDVLEGSEGLEAVGIDGDRYDELMANDGVIEIYTVVCTPTQIISGGVDKSDTNITEGTTWSYVWILVDHEDEGIEAQVLIVASSSTMYCVKLTGDEM